MRKLALILACVFLLPVCLSTVSCKQDKTLTLNVYNWEEYIDESILDEFENYYYETHNKKVIVNYSTYGTCENMYNELKLSQDKNTKNYKYDLVCPSDYMIQRMIEEDMCEKYDWSKMPNYTTYTSEFIKDLFDKPLDAVEPINKNLTQYKLSDYAACYMWGTMGFVYNPEEVADSDMQTWSGIKNPKYKNKTSIKDSPRDSYVLAMGIAYQNELNSFASQYKNGTIDLTTYQKSITDLFNKIDNDTITKTSEHLRDIRSNLYSFEVDSGKIDMATGKLWINFAWSGDAVYILDEAESMSGTELKYSVPKEGSNIFFDGWVMPKGANKELAQEFLNYMFEPENAVLNMEEIGYTVSSAGIALFENAIDWYGATSLAPIDKTDYEKVIAAQEKLANEKTLTPEEEEDAYRVVGFVDGKYWEELYFQDYIDKVIDPEGFGFNITSGDAVDISNFVYDDEENIVGIETQHTPIYIRDLTYFFGEDDQDIIDAYGAPIIYCDTLDRQFSTQYPDEEVVNRCTIMKHLTNTDLEELNEMWSSVKIGYMPPIVMILILLLIIAIVVLVIVFFKLAESGKFGYGKERKNLTLVSKEEIK